MQGLIKNPKFHVLIALCIGLIVGLSLRSGPSKVEQIEKTQVKQEQQKEENKDVKIVIKEVIRPDGTKEKETVIENKESKKEVSKSEVKTEKEIKIDNRPDYRLGLIYKPTLPTQKEQYQITLEKRIFGELYLGLSGSTDKTFGVSLSVGF